MPGTRVYVQPCDLWGYFEDNFEALCCEFEIAAENQDVDIYICFGADEDDRTLYIQAWIGDDLDDEITVETDVAAEAALAEMYRRYLSDDAYDDDEYKDDNYTLTPKDIAIERERELNDALEDFIRVVSPTDATKMMTSTEGDKAFKDIKEHFLEYLYRKHKVNIFRPMLMDYGDGCPEYEEYPYDNMEFDDETNPIYMS